MNPLINLAHLKFFCDAAACKSITEAAKNNFVTQSTISQAIAKLERMLEADLIAQPRHKFQLSPEGKILFEEARHIFKSLHETQEKIKSCKGTLKGSLKFACTNSLGMSFIAPTYRKMQENAPNVELNIQLGNLRVIKNALAANEVEFAVVISDATFAEYSKHTLQKGRFHLYQNKDAPHHLIEKGILVDYREGMFVVDLQAHLSSLKIEAALGGWEVVARFAEQNIGVGFFPDYLVANGRYPTLIENSITLPSFEYEIVIVHRKGIQFSKPAKAFIDQFTLI